MASESIDKNKPIRSIDGMVAPRPSAQAPKKPTRKKLKLPKLRIRLFNRRRTAVWAAGVCAILIVGSLVYWRLVIWQPAVVDPFTPQVLASVQFPLYYPTQLPTGFRIDKKSVTSPTQGVIVFYLTGPKNAKLYISEEARPSTFNLGGFYNTFQGLKETGVSDGAVAVGRLNNSQTEVASRANNTTWTLSNTTAKVPLNQLTAMLKSLTHTE